MSIYTDLKYIQLVGQHLNRFTKKDTYLWNFRCPFCGDSRKKKSRARGYVYRRGQHLNFYCHNCPESGQLKKLLYHVDPNLARQYVMETYLEKREENNIQYDQTKAPGKLLVETSITDIPGSIRISELPSDHIAVQYLVKRKIPEKYFSELFFTENYAETIQRLMSNGRDLKLLPEKRIIIPFYNENNILTGLTGRSIEKSELRYITLKLLVSEPKIYGLNRIDKNDRVLVLEGPFDSMFLPNAIATLDSHLYRVNELFQFDKVLVFDNEPRNKNLIQNMNKAVALKMNICVWPKELSGLKDINNMVLAGWDPIILKKIIDDNTFSGIRAKLEIDKWRM